MTVAENDLLVGPVVPSNGVTLISIDFYFEAAADLEVYKSGSNAPLTISVDYTVSLPSAAGATDGSITLTTPANGTDSYAVYGKPTLARSSDLQFRGDLRSQVFNDELDRIWRAIQSINTALARSFQFSQTSDIPDALETLTDASRADKVIGFSADGSGLEVKTPNDDAYFSLPLGVSQGGTGGATAAAARTNLGLGSAAVADLLDEDDLASNDDTAAPTQQSVKAYVDAQVGGGVSDGDKGDIVVSGSGSVWSIEAGAVDTAELADDAVTIAKIADAVIVTEAEGISSNDNDTTLPTSAAVKDYVDNAGSYDDADARAAQAGHTAGGIGSYVLAYSTAGDVAFGSTVAGSTLRPTSAARGTTGGGWAGAGAADIGTALSGTWRCMGTFDAAFSTTTYDALGVSLWLRIS